MSAARHIVPAALALRDFRTPGQEARDAPPQEPGPRRPAPDMRRLLRAAYLTGRRKEARAAQVHLQQALKTLDETHARRLEEERARWQREIAGELAMQLQEGLAALEDRLRTTLADILAPVLEKTARDHAVRAFVEELRAHLAGKGEAIIKVTGPPAMLEALREALGPELAGILNLSPAPDGAELSAIIDETALTTRVAEWARKHLPEHGR